MQILKYDPICWELSRTLEMTISFLKSKVGSRRSEVGGWKSEVGSSNTNITNLGWNNILLRLQIGILMYMWDSKTYEGYFQPIRGGIKNSRWRRPWKCNRFGKQHWGGPGIGFHGANFKIDTVHCSPKQSLWSLTIGGLLNQTFHISKQLIWRVKISGFYCLHAISEF